jgi:hypothetical protein
MKINIDIYIYYSIILIMKIITHIYIYRETTITHASDILYTTKQNKLNNFEKLCKIKRQFILNKHNSKFALVYTAHKHTPSIII